MKTKMTVKSKKDSIGPWHVSPDVIYTFQGDRYRLTSLGNQLTTYEFEGESAIAIWAGIAESYSREKLDAALEKKFGPLGTTEKKWVDKFIKELVDAKLISAAELT